jgi:ATP-dependent protease ClpP protease subunit
MKSLRAMLILLLVTTSIHGDMLEITTTNSVVINESISSASVTRDIQELATLDYERINKSDKIYIVLNSPGGSIMAGNKLINFANTIDNVHTICMFCASMAHAISQGVTGTRYATIDNIMMAHRARGTFSGQFEDGEVESQLKLFKSLVRSMEQRNSDRIGITLKDYKSKVRNEWWTYGGESLKLNVIDETIRLKCSQGLINKKIKTIVMTMFGPMEGPEKSACPLM